MSIDIEEIKSLLESINSEANDIYNQAGDGEEHAGDDDPCASDVSTIISNSWDCFSNIKDYSCSVTNLVEEILGYLEGKTPTKSQPSVCTSCGERG